MAISPSSISSSVPSEFRHPYPTSKYSQVSSLTGWQFRKSFRAQHFTKPQLFRNFVANISINQPPSSHYFSSETLWRLACSKTGVIQICCYRSFQKFLSKRNGWNWYVPNSMKRFAAEHLPFCWPSQWLVECRNELLYSRRNAQKQFHRRRREKFHPGWKLDPVLEACKSLQS